jgi:hypothetical protein
VASTPAETAVRAKRGRPAPPARSPASGPDTCGARRWSAACRARGRLAPESRGTTAQENPKPGAATTQPLCPPPPPPRRAHKAPPRGPLSPIPRHNRGSADGARPPARGSAPAPGIGSRRIATSPRRRQTPLSPRDWPCPRRARRAGARLPPAPDKAACVAARPRGKFPPPMRGHSTAPSAVPRP